MTEGTGVSSPSLAGRHSTSVAASLLLSNRAPNLSDGTTDTGQLYMEVAMEVPERIVGGTPGRNGISDSEPETLVSLGSEGKAMLTW